MNENEIAMVLFGWIIEKRWEQNKYIERAFHIILFFWADDIAGIFLMPPKTPTKPATTTALLLLSLDKKRRGQQENSNDSNSNEQDNDIPFFSNAIQKNNIIIALVWLLPVGIYIFQG